MGGADKGWLEFQGRPLIAHALERFAPQVDEVIISATRNIERYAAWGHRVVVDETAVGQAGPLAGLHAALALARYELVASVPCDSPHLPVDLVERLYDGMHAASADIAVARTAQGVHPVFCLCRRRLRDALSAFLAAGGRQVQAWYREQRYAEVGFDDEPEAFKNINAPEDLERNS
jgi:molybdopterin-guanine dinucleotide biosynthesis protein A